MTLTPALPVFSRLATRRRAVRSGCAMALALTLAANPGRVAAQSFLGTPEVVLGEVFVPPGEGSFTNVFVGSEQAIINWQLPSSPLGNTPEVFQPEGTTAIFEGGSVNSFTVLNRILPVDTANGGGPVNRAVQFNGTIESPSNSSIWFYSPSGIVIGSTAAFNVGNLVLTSNDIDTTDGLYGLNGEIRFRGAASSLSPVEIQAGAVINGVGQGSYLAIVAPRIVQAGRISADGHVALVAAEQADITINAGLLDIVVTQGTTDPNGIDHTGSTGGPASGASDDRQILSLIAMPKNTALTMLLSGSIGYTPAASAQDEGSSVVLSAGHASYLSNADLAQNLGSISIGNTQFTSAITAVATNAINITPTAGTVEFQQEASLTAYRSISAVAGDGETIIAGDDLFLHASQGATGGSVNVRAEGGALGGEITATNGLYITANGASSLLFPEGGEGIDATGGTVTLAASGGRISANMIQLEASGSGLNGEQFGGDGRGGSVTASVSGGGSITTTDFFASADGYAGYAQQNGGDGFGGTVSLLGQGGTLALGQVMLIADGVGGQSGARMGDGQSGSVLIDITNGEQTWSDLSVQANAVGGEAYFSDTPDAVAGNATGRTDAIRLHVGSGARLNITDDANLVANVSASTNGAGNTGSAGGISVLVDGGGTLRVDNTLTISADATVPPESQFYDPRTSPTLTGGTVNVLANGGVINVHALRASANASGSGAQETAGSATGGTATVGAADGGTIRTFAVAGNAGSIIVEANAEGSYGFAPSDAIGGTATLFASDGGLDVDGDILVSSNAGSSPYNNELPFGSGFAARGGTASLELRAGTTGAASLNAANISVIANGDAGSSALAQLAGNAGSGSGGTARLSVAAGMFTTGTATIQADGLGGTGATGGNGIGGTAAFLLNDSMAGTAPRSIATLSLLGRGIAGTSNSGPAATATAGQTQLVANAGSQAGAVTISGDFIAEATGAIAPAGNGFVANVGGGAFNVGGNTSITTSRDVSMTITAGGALATQGTLTIATPRGLTSTGLISTAGGATITANLGISMSDLQSGGATLLSAVGGPIAFSNNLSSAGLVSLIGPAANIRSLGALTLGDVSTAGNFSVEAGGDLLTGTVAVTGTITLASTGGWVQTAGTVSGAGIAITAANGVFADADLISTGALQVQTGGILRIGGRAIGTAITALSGDLAIGPNGSIGQRGITQSITLLNSNPASPTFIGGAAQSGGYSLDAAEITRLAADSSISLGLSLNAAPTAADLVIGGLALTYGANGNIGTGGILKINAPGRIAVNGAVALTTSSNADRFSIDPTRIDIDTDTGSIIMQGANGDLMGQLELVAGTIAVASGATLAAIANLSNPADINAALDAAPSNPNDAGYLRAGSILLNAENAIYIANTGASAANADRRGFTAGNLSIITGSPATHVSINGVLIDSSGGAITGQDTLALISVNGAPATTRGFFSQLSTVNGCVMGSQSCNAPLTNEMIKTKSDIEVPLDPDGNTPQFTYILEIDEREPDDQQPLVDEPVTGVGNDDLWNGACGSNPGACPQGGNSQ